MLDNLPEVVTVQELAEFVKISESTIWRHIKNGDLKALKIGKNVRIEKAEVIKWAKEKEK